MKKPEDFGITKYDKKKFKKTGILDCFQNVNLSNLKLTKIPFNFGTIEGFFSCSNNNLNSLKGSPRIVSGSFYCFNNKLKSLKNSPEKVFCDFYCDNNKLKSLKNISECHRDVYCEENPIDMTVKDWIEVLEKCPNSDLFKYCQITSDNSTYENVLNCLKEKLAILEALD